MKFGFILMALAINQIAYASDAVSHCAEIEDADARLGCYDRVLRKEEPTVSPATKPIEPAPSPGPIETGQKRATPAKPPEETFTEQTQEDFGITLFGKGSYEVNETERITSRIESVRTSSAGRRVMTLENGQVWMEREPGRRRIDADQKIEITKHRWHYSMSLLEQNHRVSVQRID